MSVDRGDLGSSLADDVDLEDDLENLSEPVGKKENKESGE